MNIVLPALRVLIVEDSADDAFLLVRELKRAYDVSHHQVFTADGLRAALADAWDVVLSDWSLPQFDGLAAFQILRESGADLPFIIVSGAIDEVTAVSALEAGVHDFVTKGSFARLLPAIDRELREAEIRKRNRRNEQLYRQMFEASPLPMWTFDRETLRFAAVNAAAIRHYGYSEAEFLAMTIEDIRPREDLGALRDDVYGTSGPSMPRRWRHRKKDGSLVTVEIQANDLEADGRAVRLVLVNDVTDRELAERALHRAEEQLRQAQKMDAIGRLAGGVAHDFNNLLSVILTCSSFVLDELREGDPLREDLEQIQSAGKRAAELTRQLLAFSRHQPIQARILDVNHALAATEKMLRRLLGAGITLTLLPQPARPWHIKADPSQLEQVVLNVAINARDAMPDGGKLTIETKNVELDEEYARLHHDVAPGEYVMIAITDTGTGMDADTQRRIFEPFFTTKPKGKGTGLGLATVFGIVKQACGHIWLYSEPGHGTTFKIYFPRAVEAVERTPEPPAPAPTRGNETILLVEDDDQVRPVVVNILRRQGYRVLECSNGGEALLACEQHPATIHLLLTDVVLPRMNGRQLAERLVPVRPTMKVLYMSGFTDDAILQHGVLESTVAYLQKPITPDALAYKVREVLDSRV